MAAHAFEKGVRPGMPELNVELESILEQLVEGVILTDLDGKITFVNEAARLMHGVAELGVTVEDYSDTYHLLTMDGRPYPPEELPLARAVLRGETVVDEFWRIQRPDGTEVVAQGSARPIITAAGRQEASVLTLRDVTIQHNLQRERDALDEERRESERLLSITLRSIGDAVIATDSSGRITFMNNVAERLTGWTEAEAAGRECEEVFRIVSEYSVAEIESAVAGIGLEGKAAGLANHTILAARDGTEYPIEHSRAPIRDEAGSMLGAVLVFHDVSASRLSEQVLRQSETRFRTLVAQSPLSIQILDPDGRTIEVNRAWEQLWGLTLDDLSDYNMLQDAQLVEKGIMPYIQRAFAGEAVAIPSVMYDPEQTLPNRTTSEEPRRWTRAQMYPVKSDAGDIHEVVLIHEDITDQVEAEQALRNSEERYRRMLETAQEGVWIIDSAENTTFVNGKMTEMLGYSAEEMMGRSLLSFMDLEASARVRGKLVKRRMGVGEQYDNRFKRKDGADLWVIVNATPVFDGSGRYDGSFAMLTDISARKQVEEAVLRYQGEIESLNARLERSIQETHHRVKNNLQMISALVELQAQSEGEMVPAAAMHRIGQHTLSLAAIHDLLTQQVKGDPHSNIISARAVLDRLIVLLQATVEGRQIRHAVADLNLPVQSGTSLALLTAEIVNNAVKHGRGEIELTLTAEGAVARLEICDNGSGFPPDFDWKKAANTGLSLIDMTGRFELRGSVTYDNRPEGGARVVVTFPLSSAPLD